MSYLSVFGCAYLILTGLMLLFALMLEKQGPIQVSSIISFFLKLGIIVLIKLAYIQSEKLASSIGLRWPYDNDDFSDSN